VASFYTLRIQLPLGVSPSQQFWHLDPLYFNYIAIKKIKQNTITFCKRPKRWPGELTSCRHVDKLEPKWNRRLLGVYTNLKYSKEF